ncbi:hypothetical protein EZV62_022194 [Acer yangbiense]|uniref:Uncharacterized protein n=1 Tax=Acer yangbiense TaxID=1000413 RepID=A0A5C7H975_9ROSI|nr:hypothetical protein EZV62_022194 [Acer yangbiense]
MIFRIGLLLFPPLIPCCYGMFLTFSVSRDIFPCRLRLCTCFLNRYKKSSALGSNNEIISRACSRLAALSIRPSLVPFNKSLIRLVGGLFGAVVGVLLACGAVILYRKWDRKRKRNASHQQFVSSFKSSVLPSSGAKCGRKVLDTSNSSSFLLITDWAWMLAKTGKVEEIFDEFIRNEGPKGVMERFVQTGHCHLVMSRLDLLCGIIRLFTGGKIQREKRVPFCFGFAFNIDTDYSESWLQISRFLHMNKTLLKDISYLSLFISGVIVAVVLVEYYICITKTDGRMLESTTFSMKIKKIDTFFNCYNKLKMVGAKVLPVYIVLDQLEIWNFNGGIGVSKVLLELLSIEGIGVECGGEFRHSVEYGSDVWSLACVLIELLVGKQYTQELIDYIHSVSAKATEGNSLDCFGMYTGWLEKVRSLMEAKLGTEFVCLQQMLCQCLNFDPLSRPLLTDVWKCIRELIFKPEFVNMIKLDNVVNMEDKGHCLVLGEMCWLPKRNSETQEKDDLSGVENSAGADIDQVEAASGVHHLVEGISEKHFKFKDMQGHLDCVTGLAIGGGFLFSSSFDKTVHVWSLQDFSHVHTFKGHDQKVMAVVYVDEEAPLCISGDSGGGIYVWSICVPLGQEPLRKWNELKDWRYSGIHAMTTSGKYLYTGSGDKTIKAWSFLDGTLVCTMNGHKSVVSTLAVCNGVLYSGSWDGTIRLWSLSDHSLLTVLGEDNARTVSSVLSLSADQQNLVTSHENGSIKVWRDDVFMKSTQIHNGSIFAICMEEKRLFTGGWDQTVKLQELIGDDFQVDAIPIGSIPCGSVITALLYWQGKLFVGYADRTVKVYYYEK